MAEITLHKLKRKPKLTALFKINPKHLAILEGNTTKSGVSKRNHAHVTGNELAIFKSYIRKIGVGEVALFEGTVLIISFLEWMDVVILTLKR